VDPRTTGPRLHQWRSVVLRAVYVVVSIGSAAFPGTIVYLVLWLVLPREE
jgi:phage shock protein C